MSLEDALKKKRQTEQKAGINHRPEIDAKIDTFIAENPEVYQKLQEYTKEDLVRKRILDMVNANERREGYSAEMRHYVEQNPEIKRDVERRISKLPESQREGAFTRIAKTVIAAHSMRQATAATTA